MKPFIHTSLYHICKKNQSNEAQKNTFYAAHIVFSSNICYTDISIIILLSVEISYDISTMEADYETKFF